MLMKADKMAEKLRQYMYEHELTTKGFSEKAKVSRSTVESALRGGTLNFATYAKISKVLNGGSV